MQRRYVLTLALCGFLAGCGGKPAATPGANPNEVKQFHEAVRDGDVEIVRRLLAARPYLANARDDQGVSPLKAAEQQGSQELADLIREKGGKE